MLRHLIGRRAALAGTAAACASVVAGHMPSTSLKQSADPSYVVCSPTYYPTTDDDRFKLGLAACERAKALGVPLLLVDASPAHVKAALRDAGADVRDQTFKGRKGAALRECIHIARGMLPDNGVICFQELEKVEMIGLQRTVANHVITTDCDVCVPRREDSLFQRTYPIEQYHSETFANLGLDALGRAIGLPALDWTFGPVALRASMAEHWLNFDGELWDAQIVPFIRAFRWASARVASLQVTYSHPSAMKKEEEGVALWSEKRLMQLNFLWKHVAVALKEDSLPPP